MKTAVILGVMLLFVSTVEAGALIEGYGDVRFGDSLEEIRAAYPAIKKDNSGVWANSGAWACDVEAPFMFGARARFVFNGQNALVCVQISGILTSADLIGALNEKYGMPASGGDEWVPIVGNVTSGIWNDAKGNRLWVKGYHESANVFLRYMSAAMATALDKELAEERRKQLEGL